MTWYFFLAQHAHLASLCVCWPPNSILLPSSIFLGWLSCLISFCPVIGQSASLRKQLQQHIVTQCKGTFHKVVIRGVPFKSLLCAQGLFCLPYVSYTTRFPPPAWYFASLQVQSIGACWPWPETFEAVSQCKPVCCTIFPQAFVPVREHNLAQGGRNSGIFLERQKSIVW